MVKSDVISFLNTSNCQRRRYHKYIWSASYFWMVKWKPYSLLVAVNLLLRLKVVLDLAHLPAASKFLASSYLNHMLLSQSHLQTQKVYTASVGKPLLKKPNARKWVRNPVRKDLLENTCPREKLWSFCFEKQHRFVKIFHFPYSKLTVNNDGTYFYHNYNLP